MNILIINKYYYPNMIGGTEHSVKLLAEGLQKGGHNVCVYTQDGTNLDLTKEQINDICIYRGFDRNNKTDKRYTAKFVVNFFRKFINFNIIKDLNKIMSEFNPDIIHTNNLPDIIVIVWKYFYQKNIPIIHTLRDTTLMNHFELSKKNKMITISSKIINPVYTFIMRRVSQKYVCGVTAPSKYTLDRYLSQKYFSYSKQFVVENGVSLDINDTKSIIDTKNKRTGKIIHFLYAGGLYKHKGIVSLLMAFSRVESDQITLTICGASPDNSSDILDNINKDKRVRYIGKVSESVLKNQYKSADVLIVPSLWEETFGRVIIEGNQFGLPVIGSNRGGIVEIIQNMGSGVIYNYTSVEELAKTIEYFCDRDVVKSYFDNILTNISRYDNQHSVHKYIESYNDLINDCNKNTNTHFNLQYNDKTK